MWGLSDPDIQLISQVLSKHPDIKEAIVFGSRAKGAHRKGSDVDIALKGEVSNDTILEVSTALNQEVPLPYFFDIVSYNTINNADLKSHIDRVGTVIYSGPA